MLKLDILQQTLLICMKLEGVNIYIYNFPFFFIPQFIIPIEQFLISFPLKIRFCKNIKYHGKRGMNRLINLSMQKIGTYAFVTRRRHVYILKQKKVHMYIRLGINFSTCIRKVIKSKQIIFCIYELSQKSCTFANWIPSCLYIIHGEQICKTLYLKYSIKHQGDSEVGPKLTAHHVVRSKKSKVQVGYGCEHTSNIFSYPTPPTPTSQPPCQMTLYVLQDNLLNVHTETRLPMCLLNRNIM